LVREKRRSKKLREAAQEIGIGAATLMRVENGRIPDLTTFGKICKWLEVDPGAFLGFEKQDSSREATAEDSTKSLLVSAHLRADHTSKPETIQALATMIYCALKNQPKVEETPNHGNP
jgi:DNA-binding Xre family transcriptional regulator